MTTEYALDMLLKGFKPTDELDFASLARELLAARKVVAAIKEQAKEAQGRGVISINVWSAIYAYDAATKGE